MNQRVLSGNLIYKGTLDGLMQTWRNEGFFALYKGFWPNWLRLGPWNIIVSFKTGLYFVYDGSGNVSKRSHTHLWSLYTATRWRMGAKTSHHQVSMSKRKVE